MKQYNPIASMLVRPFTMLSMPLRVSSLDWRSGSAIKGWAYNKNISVQHVNGLILSIHEVHVQYSTHICREMSKWNSREGDRHRAGGVLDVLIEMT